MLGRLPGWESPAYGSRNFGGPARDFRDVNDGRKDWGANWEQVHRFFSRTRSCFRGPETTLIFAGFFLTCNMGEKRFPREMIVLMCGLSAGRWRSGGGERAGACSAARCVFCIVYFSWGMWSARRGVRPSKFGKMAAGPVTLVLFAADNRAAEDARDGETRSLRWRSEGQLDCGPHICDWERSKGRCPGVRLAGWPAAVRPGRLTESLGHPDDRGSAKALARPPRQKPDSPARGERCCREVRAAERHLAATCRRPCPAGKGGKRRITKTARPSVTVQGMSGVPGSHMRQAGHAPSPSP